MSKKIEEIRKGTDNDEDEIINLEPIIVSKAKEREQKDMNKIEIVAEVHMEENGKMRKDNKERGTNKTIEDRDSVNHQLRLENNDESKAKKYQQERVIANNSNKAEEKEVCWYWKNRKCRYEDNCKKDHPEQCKTMMEEGKCKNNRCKLMHPKICRNSFYKGYCNRGGSCWFIHPSKCNNQQNNMTNISNSWGTMQDNYNQQAISNQNLGNQNQLQNNMNQFFLGQWPQIRNNYNTNNQMWKGSENQTMLQMMENMMQKIRGMEDNIIRIETGRQFNRM